MFKRCRVLVLAAGMIMAAATQAAEHPAQEMVVGAVTDVLTVYREEGDRLKADPAYLKSKIDELILPHLDFETMTRLAVSKFWRRADTDQQRVLVDEFQLLLLNTYTNALNEYNGDGGDVEFEPFRPEDRPDRAEVRSSFIPSGGSKVPVVYKLRDKDGWKIYDIEVNDVSLVTGYRSAFSAEIERNGIDGLIQTLKERNGKS